MVELTIRPARPEDVAQIQAIYAYHVIEGFGSFEEVPPDIFEMGKRFQEIIAQGLPYFVAERDRWVVGYCYASPFRSRSAYRYTLEDSIYVAPNAAGQGVGRTLLTTLITKLEAADYRQLVAVIGDSGNVRSIGLHKSLGFVEAGLLKDIAYKRRRWVDAVILQRRLGRGDTAEPSRP